MNKKSERNFINESLREIYGDEKKLDFSSLEYKKQRKAGKYFFLATIFLALALIGSWLVFFFFGAKEFGGGVTLSFDGPGEISSGSRVEYILRYKNNESLSLGEANIEVKMPKNFTLESSEPSPGPDGIWRIGAVPSGGEGAIKLGGAVLGNLGDSVVWQGVLTYRPVNFNADFEQVATFPAVIKDSFFSISVEGPDKVIPGEAVEYKISFQNKDEKEADGVEIRAVYPTGFIFKAAAASPSAGNNIWTVGKLGPKSGSSLILKGSFGADAVGKQNIVFSIGIKKDLGYLKQAESSLESEVAASGLGISLTLNGSAETKTADFGDTLNYLLSYKNQGSEIIENAEINLAIASSAEFNGDTPLLIPTLAAEPGGKISDIERGRKITWDKKKIAGLAKILPGGEGAISVKVKLRGAPFAAAETKDYKIIATAGAKVGRVGNLATGLNIEAPPLEISLLSDTRLAASARYYDETGAALGDGPLPPQAGAATKYRIFWEAQNSLHEIGGIEVSAILPAGVKFTGNYKVEAGEINYESAGRRVVWKLNRLPLSVPKIGINFEVEITPGLADVGKIIRLSSETNLAAKDTWNGGAVERIAPPVDTSLVGDSFGAGQGKVEK
ncbi:MAG: hypothetical protein AAB731_04855 [Patescibacteria group bacterium]